MSLDLYAAYLVACLVIVIVAPGHWFNWLRLSGAAYLVWLGC